MATFDLDRELGRYLKRLDDKRLVSRDARDEIEGHLRDEIDDLIAAGHTPQEALERAVAAFGSGEALRSEFTKLYGARRLAQLSNVLSYYFDRRVIMRVFFGFALGAFFMVAGLLLEGGRVSSMVQVTAALIVAGGAFGALLIAYPARVVLRSIGLALTGREAVRSACLDAAKVFGSYGDLAILSGFVGALFGTVHVLEHLDRIDTIGPGVAVAVISLLYGLLIKLFVGRPLHDAFMARAFPNAEAVRPAVGPSGGSGLSAA